MHWYLQPRVGHSVAAKGLLLGENDTVSSCADWYIDCHCDGGKLLILTINRVTTGAWSEYKGKRR